jgi:hypothetical protein
MCQEINFLNFKAATLDICEELKVKNCFLTFNIYFLTHNKCKKCIFFFFFFFCVVDAIVRFCVKTSKGFSID